MAQPGPDQERCNCIVWIEFECGVWNGMVGVFSNDCNDDSDFDSMVVYAALEDGDIGLLDLVL